VPDPGSKRSWIAALIIGVALFVFGGGWLVRQGQLPLNQDQEADIRDTPLALPSPPEVDPDLIISLLDQDSIRAIDEPLFISANEAQEELDPEERVIGVVINGDARAYPLPILSRHEIVNDVIGEEPVAVTWCPLCYTALVFSRNVEGISGPLSLGVSGKLLYNTLVMYDRQSNTLWSQLYGAAIDGALQGQTLEVFPSVLTDWATWVAQQPDSLVLSKRLTCEQFDCGTYSTNPRGSYVVDPYESYYNTPFEGVIDYQIPREEYTQGPKERLFGLRIGGQAKAYPFKLLAETPVVNDEIQGFPVVVWFDPETETGFAYGRAVGERIFTFRADPVTPEILIDRESESRWQIATGLAVAGPLRGEQLAPLVVTAAFEFGWYAYFPNSATYAP
jgi:hypothetical protein